MDLLFNISAQNYICRSFLYDNANKDFEIFLVRWSEALNVVNLPSGEGQFVFRPSRTLPKWLLCNAKQAPCEQSKECRSMRHNRGIPKFSLKLYNEIQQPQHELCIVFGPSFCNFQSPAVGNRAHKT